jgi:hypothetical protein
MKGIVKSATMALAMVGCVNSGFASLQDCLNATKQNDEQKTINLCKPYVDSNPKINAILSTSYWLLHQYDPAISYGEKFLSEYGNKSNLDSDTKASVAGIYMELGNVYYFGQGGHKDTEKGLGYITKGAELGNATAQYQLGSFYGQSDAEGVNKNFVNNYYWESLANLNGESDKAKEFNFVQQNYDTFMKQYPYCIALGQDNVGQAYYQGIGGLDQSNLDALDWMQKAADTDPTLSVTNLDLAKMYHINGDDDKAFEYAQKATNQPLAQAMQYLGTLYQQGAGTDKDSVKAYAYLTLAVDLYNNPDTDFWNKFAAPCMPNYQGTTKEFNVDVAKQQLENISLNDQQKEQANKLIEEVKSHYSK